MSMDDLLPRLKRVIHLMSVQLSKLTTKDLMNFLKSVQFKEFMQTLSALELDHQVDAPFFKDHINKILEWQDALPGGITNVKRDFIKVYMTSDSVDRAEIKEKVLLHRTKRMKSILQEFFRLLDASVASKKTLPLEAFAQHLGLTLKELVVELDRVNWSDVIPEISVEEEEISPFIFPIQIEKDFLNYYQYVDRPTQLEIQEKTTQGIKIDDKPKLKAFYQWLDDTPPSHIIDFSKIAEQIDIHSKKLLKYLERINWL